MIDLGTKSPIGGCCGEVPMPVNEPSLDYPGTWLRFSGEDDPELPKEGTMTVHFKVREKTVKDRDKGVKVEYSIDLTAIDNVKKSKVEEVKPSTGEALDKLLAESMEDDD
jgi:hypothetical protein